MSQFSFPYPKVGGEVRAVGEGCTACVHRTYCPAIYWFRRYGQSTVSPHQGRQCLSWSDDPADRISGYTQADVDENDYLNDQGIPVEPTLEGRQDNEQ